MIYKTIYLLVFILISGGIFGQDYSSGFRHLEKGEFQDAYVFFKAEIEKGNDNFTTRLCLGRAIGLSGDPEAANEIFRSMRDSFPDNIELKLNLSESFLWLKEYQQAKIIYEEILRNKPNSFPAVLGYANTLSSLKDYEEANVYINKALQLDSLNQNAKISKKYILLGLAGNKKMADLYDETLLILEKLDALYPIDIDVTLSLYYHHIDMKNFSKARLLLEKYIQSKQVEPRILQAKASLATIQKQFQLASTLLNQAKLLIPKHDRNAGLYNDILIQEANSYIADKKYNKALSILDTLKENNINENKFSDLLANYFLAKEDYQSIDSLISTSNDRLFKLKLKSRKAMQMGDYRQVKVYLDSMKSIDQTNVFNHYFSKELNPNLYLQITPIFNILDDNGGNHAEEKGIRVETSNKYPWRLYFSYNERETRQFQEDRGSRKSVGGGMVYNLPSNVTLQAGISNATTVISENENNFLNYNGSMQISLNQKHNLTFFYNSKIYDYNTQLIKSNINEKRKGIKYYNGLSNIIGFYGEGALTNISDGNKSSFLFLSVFKNFKELPLMQLGLNYTFLSFENQNDVYFSIENYQMKEVFVKFDNRYVPGKKTYLSLLAAFGSQNANKKKENTQRLEAELGFKFGKRSTFGLFAAYNNASSATIGGYQVTRMGIKSSIRL